MNLSLRLVKKAADAQADAVLAREAQWLRSLEEVPELEGQVPRLVEEGRSADGRRFLVMSIVPIARGETRGFTADHARFLASLGKARFRAMDFDVSGAARWLLRSLAELEAFAPSQAVGMLGSAFHDCETALLYWTGPYVLAQGDFAPWHIRYLAPQLFVSDWGNARSEASPLEDVLHYLMIQRALSGTALSVPVLQAAMERARDFAVRAYPQWRWRPKVIGALTLVYLLGSVLQRALGSRSIDLADPVVGGYWKLLGRRSQWMPMQD